MWGVCVVEAGRTVPVRRVKSDNRVAHWLCVRRYKTKCSNGRWPVPLLTSQKPPEGRRAYTDMRKAMIICGTNCFSQRDPGSAREADDCVFIRHFRVLPRFAVSLFSSNSLMFYGGKHAWWPGGKVLASLSWDNGFELCSMLFCWFPLLCTLTSETCFPPPAAIGPSPARGGRLTMDEVSNWVINSSGSRCELRLRGSGSTTICVKFCYFSWFRVP